jgi:hypothetical protein
MLEGRLKRLGSGLANGRYRRFCDIQIGYSG